MRADAAGLQHRARRTPAVAVGAEEYCGGAGAGVPKVPVHDRRAMRPPRLCRRRSRRGQRRAARCTRCTRATTMMLQPLGVDRLGGDSASLRAARNPGLPACNPPSSTERLHWSSMGLWRERAHRGCARLYLTHLAEQIALKQPPHYLRAPFVVVISGRVSRIGSSIAWQASANLSAGIGFSGVSKCS